jgi:hypothetical protein
MNGAPGWLVLVKCRSLRFGRDGKVWVVMMTRFGGWVPGFAGWSAGAKLSGIRGLETVY